MREVLEQSAVDLVILDLMMPGEDGLLITQRIRKSNNVGIIILTGKGDPVDQIVGLEIGADDYIWAPLRIRDLTEDDWLNGLWPSAAMLAPGFPGVSRAPIELFPLQDRAQAISYSEYCHTAAARRFSWTRRRML